MTNETLTGKSRYRTHRPFIGSQMIVLQVQCRALRTYCIGAVIESEYVTYWRDARVEDIT